MTYEAIKKKILWLIAGILVWGFTLAFLKWAMTPVDGYLVPLINYDGQVTSFSYKRISWWGLKVKEYGAYHERGRFFYEMGDEVIEVEDYKYAVE